MHVLGYTKWEYTGLWQLLKVSVVKRAVVAISPELTVSRDHRREIRGEGRFGKLGAATFPPI